MKKQQNQFKIFIEKHPDTNFKRYILERAKKDPDLYRRVNEEVKQLAIAAEIMALRKKRKLTQVKLAKKASTSQSAIAQIEAGERSPTVNTLIKIADATGTKLKISFAK